MHTHIYIYMYIHFHSRSPPLTKLPRCISASRISTTTTMTLIATGNLKLTMDGINNTGKFHELVRYICVFKTCIHKV